MSGAAAMMLNNVELLEHVLLLLDDCVSSRETEPAFEQLFVLQRTNQTFRDVIQGSLGLRRMMKLGHADAEPKYLFNTIEVDCNSEQVVSWLRSGSAYESYGGQIPDALNLSVQFYPADGKVLGHRMDGRATTDVRHILLAKALHASVSKQRSNNPWLEPKASWRAIPICPRGRQTNLIVSVHPEEQSTTERRKDQWNRYGMVMRLDDLHDLGGIYNIVVQTTSRSQAEHCSMSALYNEAVEAHRLVYWNIETPYETDALQKLFRQHGECRVRDCSRSACYFCFFMLTMARDYLEFLTNLKESVRDSL